MQALIATALAAIIFLISATAMAQVDHRMHGSTATKPASSAANAALGEGQVKKVDKAKGTVTLVHGALPNGMSPMTMAYQVKDAAWLLKLQVGQKIRFATDPTDGGMTVTQFELVK